MTPNQEKRPLGAHVFTALVTTTALFLATAPVAVEAQGVWAEPVCGSEPACGVESVWGAEPACGFEPSCGLEPGCGAEPACGAEPTCGAEPLCGAEPTWAAAGGGELLGPEKGLLSRNRVPKNGPIYAALDTVAGGIQRLVSHRCPAHKSSRTNCDCSTCSHSVTPSRQTYSTHHQPILAAPPRSSTHAPHVQAAPQVAPPATTESRTTIRHNTHQPLAKPPIPQPRPLRDAEPSQPGRSFDELTDPFEDDSASHTVRRGQSILQAGFAHSDAARSQAKQDADEYADYFRD